MSKGADIQAGDLLFMGGLQLTHAGCGLGIVLAVEGERVTYKWLEGGHSAVTVMRAYVVVYRGRFLKLEKELFEKC